MNHMALWVSCVVASFVFITLTVADRARYQEPGYISPMGSKIEIVYYIGAFQPSSTDYNMNHYDAAKMELFLTTINPKYQSGQIVEVDGLKWKKETGEWTPYPNPPVPVLQPGDNVFQHTMKYAKWIEDHPHFGYPPLPFAKEEIASVTY